MKRRGGRRESDVFVIGEEQILDQVELGLVHEVRPAVGVIDEAPGGSPEDAVEDREGLTGGLASDRPLTAEVRGAITATVGEIDRRVEAARVTATAEAREQALAAVRGEVQHRVQQLESELAAVVENARKTLESENEEARTLLARECAAKVEGANAAAVAELERRTTTALTTRLAEAGEAAEDQLVRRLDGKLAAARKEVAAEIDREFDLRRQDLEREIANARGELAAGSGDAPWRGESASRSRSLASRVAAPLSLVASAVLTAIALTGGGEDQEPGLTTAGVATRGQHGERPAQQPGSEVKRPSQDGGSRRPTPAPRVPPPERGAAPPAPASAPAPAAPPAPVTPPAPVSAASAPPSSSSPSPTPASADVVRQEFGP